MQVTQSVNYSTNHRDFLEIKECRKGVFAIRTENSFKQKETIMTSSLLLNKAYFKANLPFFYYMCRML